MAVTSATMLIATAETSISTHTAVSRTPGTMKLLVNSSLVFTEATYSLAGAELCTKIIKSKGSECAPE